MKERQQTVFFFPLRLPVAQPQMYIRDEEHCHRSNLGKVGGKVNSANTVQNAKSKEKRARPEDQFASFTPRNSKSPTTKNTPTDSVAIRCPVRSARLPNRSGPMTAEAFPQSPS